MVPQMDCRSLIEFCRAFQKRSHTASPNDQRSSQSRRRPKSLNPICYPFCDNSPVASIDVVMLLLALVSFGVLIVPYFKLVFNAAYELLPNAMDVLGHALFQPPVAHIAGFVVMLATAAASWEFLSCQARKCGNSYCKGLRKAVEFDIHLESEECIKQLRPLPEDAFAARPLELGQDHKELAAELKKMAPPSGRTVLIFRAPCGCPAGRMEVWGPKKVRRIRT